MHNQVKQKNKRNSNAKKSIKEDSKYNYEVYQIVNSKWTQEQDFPTSVLCEEQPFS